STTIQRAQIDASSANTKAQIAAATAKAVDEKRLQEGQLTAQLVQHLVSKEPTRRQLAIVALRTSIPRATFDSIIEVLARTDASGDVRKLAIKELASSSSPTAPATLNTIITDSTRSKPE